MLSQLRAIFDLIIQFQHAEDAFLNTATDELHLRNKQRKLIDSKTEEVSSSGTAVSKSAFDSPTLISQSIFVVFL